MMYEFSIAKRHILRNPRMALFTVAAVTLAVAVIVVFMGIMSGFQDEIITTTVENNPHIYIQPKKDENYVHLYRTVSGILWAYPEVEAVSARLTGKGAAKYKDEVRAISFLGVNPEDEDRMMDVQGDIISGDFLDLDRRKYAAFIGTGLAEKLKLDPEEGFTLARGNRSVRIKVAGLFKTGTAADDSLIYIPLILAQDLIGMGDVVSEVDAKVADIYRASLITADLNRRLGYDSKSWQDLNADILTLIETQRVFAWIFYFLIIAIAGFGIANTMIMIVSRRTREIGILMAMGATRRSVLKIFILESLILAPPSALLGGVLAYLAAQLIMSYDIELPSEIYMVSKMTVAMRPEFFIWAMAIALGVNFAAGLYPAWKASRMDPVVAIAGG
ncbi:ABC transporter permease [Methanothrix sp.]|jgi:lipoprotein-releasing system permease protein|uniref:ABC transporter permease n=1 Tax=Methanothrix sp. TaxID=90426 RepID=UPI003C7216FA